MLDERYKEERTMPNDSSLISENSEDKGTGTGAAASTTSMNLRVEKNEPSLNDERVQKIALVYKYIMMFGDQ